VQWRQAHGRDYYGEVACFVIVGFFISSSSGILFRVMDTAVIAAAAASRIRAACELPCAAILEFWDLLLLLLAVQETAADERHQADENPHSSQHS
jgi:hypothetical protein